MRVGRDEFQSKMTEQVFNAAASRAGVRIESVRSKQGVADGTILGGSTFMDSIPHRKPGVPIGVASMRRAARWARFNVFFLLLAGAVAIAGVVLLRRLSRAKSDFAALMSHAIRTPINGAAAMTGLPLNTPAHQSGVAVRATTAFSPRKLLEDVAAMQTGRAHQKRLDLGFFVDPKTPNEVLGDAGALRQVLLNLLNNALKSTEFGSVVMRVGPIRIEGDRVWLRFTVSDTGSGAGLGLGICKRMVDLTGGQIALTSSAGKGSVVRFTAPLEVAAGGEASPESGTFRGMRVRVHCETGITHDMLAELLASLSVTPDWGDDASLNCEAAILEQGEIDVAALQSAMARLGAPAILLTGLENRVRLDSLRAAGISEVLFKPVRAANLAACLSRIRSSAQRPAPAKPGLRVFVDQDNRIHRKAARELLAEDLVMKSKRPARHLPMKSAAARQPEGQ